jgi:hypothetical protein
MMPLVTDYDVSTGEITQREMTESEYSQWVMDNASKTD